MGKSLNHQKSPLTMENHSPGCMWGLLHHIQHNRWNQAKRRLTRKPHGRSGKHSATDEAESNRIASQVQETVNSSVESCLVETKLVPPSPPHKISMRSRLKYLITEEMYKRKDRHQRSSSCPTKATTLDQTSSMQHPQFSCAGPPVDHDSLHSDSPNPSCSKNYSCELCATMRRSNYTKPIEVTEPARDRTRDELLVYAIEQNKHDSFQESKLFMDALDLLNLRKEVFLKVLQDPSSSLAHQLHRRRAPSLNKSVSFPSATTDFNKDGYNNNNSNKHLTILENSRELEISDDILKRCDNNNNNNNVFVLKRFKNLREKITHVIRDTKKEKYRIIMDSVQHMIPYGRSRVKENKLGNYNEKKLPKRTSSCDDESYDRYNQLLDISSNKEVKAHNTSLIRSNVIPRRFERILSLPNLRPCYPIQISDSSNTAQAEHKPCDAGSEGASRENLFEAGTNFDVSKTWETGSSSHDLNLEALSSSGPRPLDLGQVLENEFYYQEDEFTENESSSTPVNRAIKNEAEFYYVRDVLELSGFTRDELLGKWHSMDHPMDPMLFEEVEGDCLVSQLGCPDHLLLFDLINEVLLDIHERSFYYWPAPLTARSHMHRMPRGYRVLEEVWAEISWLLSWRPEFHQSIDDVISRDLGKGNHWMNTQMDAEFVGLEVEDLIFEDLLEEIASM